MTLRGHSIAIVEPSKRSAEDPTRPNRDVAGRDEGVGERPTRGPNVSQKMAKPVTPKTATNHAGRMAWGR